MSQDSSTSVCGLLTCDAHISGPHLALLRGRRILTRVRRNLNHIGDQAVMRDLDRLETR